MNAPNENTENTTTRRPSYWLRAIEFQKHQLLREQRRAFRDSLSEKSREGISDEDYATTMATLEKMARNLGFDESQFEDRPFGRGFGPGRAFGPGFGGRRHFGPGHPGFEGFGGFGRGHHDHDKADTKRGENTAPESTES